MTTGLKAGINFFDGAEVYSGGKAELEFAKTFKKWFAAGLCKVSIRCPLIYVYLILMCE